MKNSWQLRYFGDPILRTRCDPVEEITDEIHKLVSFMIKCADRNNGIGLAAPQVGVSLRLFILRDYIPNAEGEFDISEPRVFINPKILSKSEEEKAEYEGCLSIPGLHIGPVKRPIHIEIEAVDLKGNHFVEKREEWNARVACHENDHLNGVLNFDRVSQKIRKELEPELQAIKKKYSTK